MAVTLKNAMLTSMLTTSSNTVTLLGTTNIYTGAPPATPETAASGTLLATGPTFNASSMTQASLGTAVLSNPVAFTPTITNTAGWARWLNPSSAAAIDMDVTVAAGGGGSILSTLSLINGTPASIQNQSVQIPAALGTVMLNVALRNRLVDILCQAAGNIGIGVSGSILIYSGSAPANADAAATGTLLATIPTGVSAWATPSGGSAALVSSLVVAATATGTAGYARLVKGALTIQGSVGVGTGDFALDSLSLVSPNNTTLTNATFSF